MALATKESINVTFRVNPEEKAALEAIAGRYQVSSSLILRVLMSAQIRGLISFREYLDLGPGPA